MITPATIRRITFTLFGVHAIAMSGIFTSSALVGLAAVQIAHTDAVAGFPGTAQLLGSSAAAYLVGRLMTHTGRRVGLTLGYSIGIAGALIAGVGMIAQFLPLFLLGVCALGAARATADLARYAGADIAPATHRAQAISTIVFAGTAGAVFGPLKIAPFADTLFQSYGFGSLVGPWFASAAIFVVALLVLNLTLYPDPHEIAHALGAKHTDTTAPQPPARALSELLKLPSARIALLTMSFAQSIMVTVMTITPVHMRHNHHATDEITFVIAMHIFGMYGLSMLSGWLSDHWGRRATIACGALCIIAACLLAPLWAEEYPLAAALFLLGFGWNLCFVAGSALWTDPLALHERPALQGKAEVFVSLSAVVGSLGSGVLLALSSYGAVALLSAGLAALVLVAALRLQRAPVAG